MTVKWPLETENYRDKKNSPRLGTKLFLLFIILSFVIYMQVSAQEVTVFSDQYTQYVVEPGDTLWSISQELRPDADPRKIIFEIQEVNEITPVIYPGQKIWIPEVTN